jgi:hypothetical protein
MSKALEQELFQYILQLDEAEKKSVLQMLKTFIKGREGKEYRISVTELWKSIITEWLFVSRSTYTGSKGTPHRHGAA